MNKCHFALPVFLATLLISLPALAGDSFFVAQEDLLKDNHYQAFLIPQPNGPFAVMLLNEHALGANAGIVYFKNITNPQDGKWWISKRMWMEPPWNADVTSLLWGRDGRHLYISTSISYGDGGLFAIDLYNKSVRRIFPADEKGLRGICGTAITQPLPSENRARIEVRLNDCQTIKRMDVSLE